jgi:hypothetical protein
MSVTVMPLRLSSSRVPSTNAEIPAFDAAYAVRLPGRPRMALDLGGGRDEVDLEGLPVGVEPALPDGLALPEPGVHDHPVEGPQLGAELLEDGEDAVVVGDVELAGDDLDPGVLSFEFFGELFEPVSAPRAECQVAPLRRELAGHALAQPAARAGDQDVFPDRHDQNLQRREAPPLRVVAGRKAEATRK